MKEISYQMQYIHVILKEATAKFLCL